MEAINDKKKFKDLLLSYGIDVTPEVVLSPNPSLEEINKIEYPVVVKPVDSAGRKGISLCRKAVEFPEAYNYALKYSRSKRFW